MKKSIKHYFSFHLGLVLVVFVLLYISFFATLHCVTKHGEEITIPDVRGKDMNAAIKQLQGMHFEVSIDSTYEPDIKPLTVLKQVPDTGSSVKQGRTVFLTVNMLTPPHIPMPNLINLSFRSAQMLLQNNRLKLGDTTFKPDIAAGAILEQRYKGQPIRPGEMIPQGSKISLVIGDGLGNTEFNVPEVTGMTVDEALTVLNQYSLQTIIAPVDQLTRITDTFSARIVDQQPRAKNEAGTNNRTKAGEIIDLYISQDPAPEDIHGNNNNTQKGVNTDSKKDKTK